MNNFKYKELKKAILDGEIVEGYIATRGDWKPLLSNDVLAGAHDDKRLRIKPDCRYAMKEIKEAGGDHAVDLYTHWLGGGTLVDYCDGEDVHSIEQDPNPYETFMIMLSEEWKIAKKKETVKQVLWVSDSNAHLIPHSGNKLHADWFDEGYDPNFIGSYFRWHKVSSLTQVVDK